MRSIIILLLAALGLHSYADNLESKNYKVKDVKSTPTENGVELTIEFGAANGNWGTEGKKSKAASGNWGTESSKVPDREKAIESNLDLNQSN